MRFLFVVNPSAARVNVAVLLTQLIHEFRGHDVRVMTEVPSRSFLERCNSKPLLVAVGGDGTVQHILRKVGLPFPVPFGILPLGTANDLARAAGIPLDFAKACAVLRSSSAIAIDLMEVNGTPFATSGGLGLPASVAKLADRLRGHPVTGRSARWCGRGVYLIAALLQLVRRERPLIARLVGMTDLDEKRLYAAILLSNQPILGGFRPSPDADSRDGRLDLCAIEAPRWRPRMLWIALRAFRGQVSSCREVNTARAQSMTVITSEPTVFLGDGEVLTRGTRFEIRVRPAALPLICPQSTRGFASEERSRGGAAVVPHPRAVHRRPGSRRRLREPRSVRPYQEGEPHEPATRRIPATGSLLFHRPAAPREWRRMLRRHFGRPAT